MRDLKAINNLNQLLTYTLAFTAMLAEKIGGCSLANKLIENSNSLRSKVLFYGYQMAKGIAKILAYARTGIAEWQNIHHVASSQQLAWKFVC